jgi:Carboxypeptidase regulatory-like domain/TonB dependent receptor-like, beta-barrel/TonB-dependent Receptor Plug Domain
MLPRTRLSTIAATLAAAAAVSLLWSVPLHAQVAGATLTGTVSDPTGAVIPKAEVSIQNTATGIVTQVQANVDGLYTAPNLIPGPYEVTVSAQGFETEKLPGITLTVGAQQVLNIKMRVGQTTQTVEVTGQAAAVQLATSSVSAEVNSTTVRELPLNGRSWTDLATLQTGVNAVSMLQPTFALGTDRGNRGFGAQLSISGARPQQNNYRLDGVSLNDYGNGGPGNVLGGNIGVDAIQEFSVLTSNYSAEYGKTSGGVVNAITRSGTNQFHGSVYEFLRNSAFDATNFFENSGSLKKSPFRLNQFGASGGGPIRKDRTFIFADYEGLRRSKGIVFTDAVPSPAARAGNLSTGTVTVDPGAAKYLGLFALPNGSLIGAGDLGIYSFAAQQVVNENFFTSRLDHKFSSKDSLFGTYLYDDTPYQSPDRYNVQIIGSHTNRQFLVLEESHIFSPTLVNAVRGGYNRAGVANQQPLSAINPLATDTSLASIPGHVASDMRISGMPEFLGGLGAGNDYHYYWNSFQGYDDAFLTHGTHALKFGVGVERMQLNYSSLSNPAGTWAFGTLSAFLTNQPKSFSGALGGRLTPRGLRQTLFGAYVQDDWRWRPNLTVNLGLRYEMTTVPTEVQGKLVNLPNLTDPLPFCANIKIFPGECAATPLGSLFLNPTLRNFEPRVGFAWDPFHNGKTAVRGGFGLFDMLPLPYQLILLENTAAPFFQLGNVSGKKLPAGTFYTGGFPRLSPSSLRGTYFEHAPHRGYVMQWNFNIQRELSPNLTATVGYVGSRGVHMPFRVDDVNMVIPTQTPQGSLWPQPVGDGTPVNPNVGRTNGIFSAGNSFYHALELQLMKRMSHGLQVQGAFTWGKSIDNNSATMAGDQFGNGIPSLDWFDIRRSRGVSDFNIGRTLVINGIWQVPGLRSASGLANWISNGWQLGGIFKASDGVPFTPTVGTDGDPLGKGNDSPFDYANRLAGCNAINGNFKHDPSGFPLYVNPNCFTVPTAPSLAFYNALAPLGCDPAFPFPTCINLYGNSSRNSLVGPGISELDFSVFKNNYIRRISETFNVQFRAEFFNVLNRANFAVPVTPDNTDIFDSSGAPTGVAGLLTGTSTDPREIQFALKVMW